MSKSIDLSEASFALWQNVLPLVNSFSLKICHDHQLNESWIELSRLHAIGATHAFQSLVFDLRQLLFCHYSVQKSRSVEKFAQQYMLQYVDRMQKHIPMNVC